MPRISKSLSVLSEDDSDYDEDLERKNNEEKQTRTERIERLVPNTKNSKDEHERQLENLTKRKEQKKEKKTTNERTTNERTTMMKEQQMIKEQQIIKEQEKIQQKNEQQQKIKTRQKKRRHNEPEIKSKRRVYADTAKNVKLDIVGSPYGTLSKLSTLSQAELEFVHRLSDVVDKWGYFTGDIKNSYEVRITQVAKTYQYVPFTDPFMRMLLEKLKKGVKTDSIHDVETSFRKIETLSMEPQVLDLFKAFVKKINNWDELQVSIDEFDVKKASFEMNIVITSMKAMDALSKGYFYNAVNIIDEFRTLYDIQNVVFF